MAGYAAALLDELMGRNRDANPNDKKRDLHWSDPQVCKFFICGICPHDLFTNTRSDLGLCTRLHDESIKRDYEKSARCEKMGYEEELMKFLTTVIAEADKRIQRGYERLEMAAKETHVTPTPEQVDIDARIEAIKDQISELVAEAEQLGNDGNVDEAKEKTTLCDQLRAERLQLQEHRDRLTRPFEEVYKRRPMEVCDICGAMLFVDDAPQRLDDHIMGKQHMGYARIRTYMTEYQKKREGANNSRRAQRDSQSKERDKLLLETKSDGESTNIINKTENSYLDEKRDRSKSAEKLGDKGDCNATDRSKSDKQVKNCDMSDSIKETQVLKCGEEDKKHEKFDERKRDDEFRKHDRKDNDRHHSEIREDRDGNGRRHNRDRSRERHKSHEVHRDHSRERHKGHEVHRSRDRRRSTDRSSAKSERSRSRSRYSNNQQRSRERSSSRNRSQRSHRTHDVRR